MSRNKYYQSINFCLQEVLLLFGVLSLLADTYGVDIVPLASMAAASDGNLLVLEWVHSRYGITPEEAKGCALEACEAGKSHVLDWIVSKGYPLSLEPLHPELAKGKDEATSDLGAFLHAALQ